MPVCSVRRVLSLLLAPHTGYRLALAAAVLFIGCDGLQTAVADGDTRTISLHHVHTNEDLTVTYKRNGRYDPEALKKINWLMRDWRRGEQIEMDTRLLDLVWEVQREVGAKQAVYVICGYRSPETNTMLRRRSGEVAQFSQHMLGKAMDFYIPGAPLEELRNIGLRLQHGGIGFYPTSGSPFVHLDVGSVRHWPAMTREELVRVFPDGRTVHVPSDGHPLPGYALALADIERRGDEPSANSLDAARVAGVLGGNIDRREKPANTTLARLLGFGKSEEADVEVTGSLGETAPPAPAPLPRSRPATKWAAVAPPTPASTAQPPVAVASAKITATPLPPPASTDNGNARAEQALAYAPASTPELNARRSEVPRAAAMPTRPMPVADLIPAETSIVVKQAGGQPALVHTRREIQLAEPFNDPWLRAAILAPDLQSHMTTAAIGAPDYRGLDVFMQKPSSVVTMAFSLDPTSGLVTDRFSGQAVVFLATTSFTTRTASLQ